MDKATRGALYVEQEELEKSIAAMRRELVVAGRIYSQMGQLLQSNPERLVFANAPSPLGDITGDLLGLPPINWNEIPDKVAVAQRIRDLRVAESKLLNIKQRLQEPLTE